MWKLERGWERERERGGGIDTEIIIKKTKKLLKMGEINEIYSQHYNGLVTGCSASNTVSN